MKNYNNILNDLIPEEMNNIILNEIYLGNTNRIELLENIIYRLKLAYGVDIKPLKDYSKYTGRLAQYEIKLYNDRSNHRQNTDNINIINDKLESESSNFDKRESKDFTIARYLDDLSKVIELEFGFDEVLLHIMNNPSSFGAETITGHKLAYVSDDEITDNTGLLISRNQVKNVIIVDKFGIRFNRNKFSMSVGILIDNGLFINKSISAQEVISILLHEIGHVFAAYIINKKYITMRATENFSDIFVAMHGYAVYFINVLLKITDHYYRSLYTYSENKLETEEERKRRKDIIIRQYKHDMIDNIYNKSELDTAHPKVMKRIENIKDYIKSELKYNDRLSDRQIMRLQTDLDSIRVLVDLYHKYKENDDIIYELKSFERDYIIHVGSEKERDLDAYLGSNPKSIDKEFNDIEEKTTKNRKQRKQ